MSEVVYAHSLDTWHSSVQTASYSSIAISSSQAAEIYVLLEISIGFQDMPQALEGERAGLYVLLNPRTFKHTSHSFWELWWTNRSTNQRCWHSLSTSPDFCFFMEMELRERESIIKCSVQKMSIPESTDDDPDSLGPCPSQ